MMSRDMTVGERHTCVQYFGSVSREALSRAAEGTARPPTPPSYGLGSCAGDAPGPCQECTPGLCSRGSSPADRKQTDVV